MLDKISRMNELLDFYGPLLTEKQQEVLRLHYELDWSLAEIAEHMKITRQAVHDIDRRAETALEDYERRLGLVERFKHNQDEMKRVFTLLGRTDDNKAIAQAVALLRELT